MIAFVINVLIILVVMKLFFKFMYPKPPADFFAKAGDDTSVRTCAFCGHDLATYRGILMQAGDVFDGLDAAGKPIASDYKPKDAPMQADTELFFCNHEHQAAFFGRGGECHQQGGQD